MSLFSSSTKILKITYQELGLVEGIIFLHFFAFFFFLFFFTSLSSQGSMPSLECQNIENNVDVLLSFLKDVGGDLSPFPGDWFERFLASSDAFYASLAAIGTLIVSLALLFFIPRCLNKRKVRKMSTRLEYDALVEMTTSQDEDALLSPKKKDRRDIRCENLGLTLKSGAIVLRDINYTFKSGSLTVYGLQLCSLLFVYEFLFLRL
jgi:hypothetical protein